MAFRFTPLSPPGLVKIEVDHYPDARGTFAETYRASIFREAGFPDFVQDNRSVSHRGVLRGLHFQRPPHAQGKLVSVAAGAILDVAVDLRRDSPTVGQWVMVSLSADDADMLYVPPGFAHGFYVTSPQAIVTYKQTAEYAPAHEGGVCWDDAALGIPWGDPSPIVSPKDTVYPPWNEVLQRLPEHGADWLPGAPR